MNTLILQPKLRLAVEIDACPLEVLTWEEKRFERTIEHG